MQAPEINVIAFDVDNTLLIEHVVNEDVRDLMVAVHKLGLARIVVWSGGGEDYARMATRDCGIHHMVWKYAAKNTFFAGCRLITVDDQAVKLGEINLKIAGDIARCSWVGTDPDGFEYRCGSMTAGELCEFHEEQGAEETGAADQGAGRG